jgi:hypothetical protein
VVEEGRVVKAALEVLLHRRGAEVPLQVLLYQRLGEIHLPFQPVLLQQIQVSRALLLVLLVLLLEQPCGRRNPCILPFPSSETRTNPNPYTMTRHGHRHV